MTKCELHIWQELDSSVGDIQEEAEKIGKRIARIALLASKLCPEKNNRDELVEEITNDFIKILVQRTQSELADLG